MNILNPPPTLPSPPSHRSLLDLPDAYVKLIAKTPNLAVMQV